MNCEQYIFLIVEAAHGQLMDAAARDAAARHVETCAACAARQGQEQGLSGALRTVAAGMRDLSAPARVEANLLAAFRENLAVSRSATAGALRAKGTTPPPVALTAMDGMAGRASAGRGRWRTAAVSSAVAASLTLVALAMLYKGFTQTAPPAGQETNIASQGNREPAHVARTIAAPSQPAPLLATPTGQAERDLPQPAQRTDSMQAARHAGTQRPALTLARAATPKMIASRQVIDGGSAVFAAGDGEPEANHAAGGAAKSSEAESVTEFISLVAGSPGASPLESGQLVRVQLPRAALASLGLPSNAERADEPVKADVLLGNDGLARAIRFVR
ncbi:MAG TPA: hypothetical protein VEX70_09755 [Pyrinomonadaceae bacterium]|nr:hypothetical protein [Pyrinomonadaceae bacterium]